MLSADAQEALEKNYSTHKMERMIQSFADKNRVEISPVDEKSDDRVASFSFCWEIPVDASSDDRRENIF